MRAVEHAIRDRVQELHAARREHDHVRAREQHGHEHADVAAAAVAAASAAAADPSPRRALLFARFASAHPFSCPCGAPLLRRSPPALLARAVVLLLAVAGLSGSAAAAPASCKKVVYCLDGQAQLKDDFTSPTGKSCAVECGGNCCLNNPNSADACTYGRFAVCADDGDGSCAGNAGASVDLSFSPDVCSVFLPNALPLPASSSSQRALPPVAKVARSASSPAAAASAILVR